ncbi:MAG: Uma2 family endonuclease [Deltaproteobacteria bacterium]|nr:Uma2 family endonuclease [Deltaproteobacteria bacterium]
MNIPVEHAQLRRLSRVEYLALANQGAFRDQRVELVFGMVVEMGKLDRRQRESVRVLNKVLVTRLGDRADVYCQVTFGADGESLPEPDFYITSSDRRSEDWVSQAALVIEVADSSLAYDRNEKAALYALSNVDEYWIVDLVHGELEVRRDRDPERAIWRTVTTHRAGDVVPPLAFPDLEIAVRELVEV